MFTSNISELIQLLQGLRATEERRKGNGSLEKTHVNITGQYNYMIKLKVLLSCMQSLHRELCVCIHVYRRMCVIYTLLKTATHLFTSWVFSVFQNDRFYSIH